MKKVWGHRVSLLKHKIHRREPEKKAPVKGWSIGKKPGDPESAVGGGNRHGEKERHSAASYPVGGERPSPGAGKIPPWSGGGKRKREYMSAKGDRKKGPFKIKRGKG